MSIKYFLFVGQKSDWRIFCVSWNQIFCVCWKYTHNLQTANASTSNLTRRCLKSHKVSQLLVLYLFYCYSAVAEATVVLKRFRHTSAIFLISGSLCLSGCHSLTSRLYVAETSSSLAPLLNFNTCWFKFNKTTCLFSQDVMNLKCLHWRI